MYIYIYTSVDLSIKWTDGKVHSHVLATGSRCDLDQLPSPGNRITRQDHVTGPSNRIKQQALGA